MVTLSHQKTSLSLHIFSSPTASSSSLSTPMKLKTLIHTLIFSHIRRVVRAFAKAKSLFLELFRDNHHLMCLKPTHKRDKYMKKIIFGSFRLHYNWCSSSHVMPFPSPIMDGIDIHANSHITNTSSSISSNSNSSNSSSSNSSSSTIYYDSTWNSIFSTYDDDDHHHNDDNNGVGFMFDKEEESELSRYLQWLEEKNSNNGEGNIGNEIDKLADMFIANCHEKFRLEKIESYRRYQEMLARSM